MFQARTKKENKIIIKNYSIVNGCQSTLSFYESKGLLSENINILLRIIQTGDQDRLSQNITYYTNNQNAISLKDLKSNDKVQQDLQIEFNKLFSGEILYKIKSGEDEKGFSRVIENDFAAQLITAFYLKEPHTAHQKAEIFASNYTKIFNRHIDASYIFLLAEMYRAIDEKNILIEDEGIRTYKLTRFFFVYVFRLIFDDDPVGKELLSNPSKFLEKYQSKYFDAFSKLFQLLILDFNYNIKSEKDNNQGYFDYKNSLRNAEKTKEMSAEVVKAYKRHLVHHQEDSFSSLMS
ncbi:MAG: AIPR family protein [Anaerolineales bacterium]|nr:AIPR family protein [Anaerolineales bacterium]